MTHDDETEARLAHLAAIVEGSDDAIVSKTLQGRILTWNRGAERMFGYTCEEAVGKPMTLLFPPDRLGEEDVILAKIAAGEKVDHYETVRRRKDGQLVEVSVTVSPVRDRGGRIVAASNVARDITERRRFEEALRISNERLRRIDDERRQFVNVVAHELRTPITPLMLQLQYLQDTAFDEQRMARSVQLMERNLRRLNSLVQQLLDVARLEWNRADLRREAADLCALLADCVEVFRPAAEDAGIRLTLECDGPLQVPMDADRIAQVATNLLSNAVKFTPAGGRVLVRAQSPVATTNGPVAQVVFEDSGAGFTREQSQRLFEPFYRAHGDRPGTGLGLYISKTIVQMHGGEMQAGSPGPGRGARVAFTLPLDPSVPPANGAAEAADTPA